MERSLEHGAGMRTTAASRRGGDVVPGGGSLGGRAVKRAGDIMISGLLLVLTSPLFLVLALAIALESRGGVFFRCDRVGYRNRTLPMLKFRKMVDRASGSALTLADDDRFTRIGKFLAATKLDELPQLWNVFRGDMSLVGPRPEDRRFVDLYPDGYARILTVRPGVTGLSQIAFAKESEILETEDREGHYIRALLPQKMELDQRYAAERTVWLDARILLWTAAATLLRRDVAVNRHTLEMGFRRRPSADRRNRDTR